jgi:hypothetical protein
MKTISIFSLFFFAFVYGQAQFNDTLKVFEGSTNFDCICSDDSFYYALGGANNAEPRWNNIIVKLDKNFNIQAKRKFIDTTYNNANYPYNSMLVDGSKVIFCPQISVNINGWAKILSKIVALNKHTLDTIWSVTIVHPDTLIASQGNLHVFSDLTSIKTTLDRGYILTGNYDKNCVSSDKRSFLLKIDSAGNVQWRRTYNEYYTFFDIEIAQDSGYFVPSGLNGTNAIQLVKFDRNGNFEWRTRAMYNPMAGYPLSLSVYDSQYAFISSYFLYDTDNFYLGVNVSKVDLSSKALIWEKNFILYKTVESITLHEAMGVEALPDGSIVVSGTLRQYGADNRAFIFKLNSNGDSLWTKTYNFKNTTTARCQLNDLLVCEDDGFLGVGFDYNYSPSTAWMFKTDANGTIGWEKTAAELVEAKVYPNPATDYVTIELPENLPQNAELKLYNALGQMVFQRSLNKGEKAIKLDLKGFEIGAYFFEIIGEDGVLGSGKFVKE